MHSSVNYATIFGCSILYALKYGTGETLNYMIPLYDKGFNSPSTLFAFCRGAKI